MDSVTAAGLTMASSGLVRFGNVIPSGRQLGMVGARAALGHTVVGSNWVRKHFGSGRSKQGRNGASY